MKALSDMTPEEMKVALRMLEEELAAVQEEKDYLMQRIGHLSGQAARRLEVRIGRLKERIKAIREVLRKEKSVDDLP